MFIHTFPKYSTADMPLTIGLDVGYGVTKALTNDQVSMFPSVCGHARNIKFQQAEIASKHPGDQITDDEGHWFVGDLALMQLTPGEILKLRGRTANERGQAFRARLAKVAIGKLLPGLKQDDVVHIRLASGLPVDHMPDAELLKEALLGPHRIHTDQTNFIAHITQVMVMPQPYGTVYARMLTTNGNIDPCHTAKVTGVVDVGTYTVDLTLDNDGEYVDAESGSVEAGVFMAQERIGAMLEAELKQKMPYRVIESVLRTGCLRVSGELREFHHEVEEALEPLRSATLNLMGQLWKDGHHIDVIYLSGGGAELVKSAVCLAYKQATVVKDAQVANARGYLNYAHFADKD